MAPICGWLGKYSNLLIIETYVGNIVDLRPSLATGLSDRQFGGDSLGESIAISEMISHLVKTLQQAHNSTLDLLLVKRTASAVEPHGLEALDLGDGGGSDAGRHGE